MTTITEKAMQLADMPDTESTAWLDKYNRIYRTLRGSEVHIGANLELTAEQLEKVTRYARSLIAGGNMPTGRELFKEYYDKITDAPIPPVTTAISGASAIIKPDATTVILNDNDGGME